MSARTPFAVAACLIDSMTEMYASGKIKSPVEKYLPTMPILATFLADLNFRIIWRQSSRFFLRGRSFSLAAILSLIFSFSKISGIS